MGLLLSLLLAMTMEGESLTRETAIAQARELVAREQGLPAEDLEVERAVAVTWPDASLGCPEKDHMYAQVLSEGYRVLLRAGSARFDVRVAQGRAVLCGPRKTAAVAVADLRAADKVQRLARQDLAGRLGVAPEAVSVDFVKPRTWPDAGLGCAGGEAAAEPQEVPGFEVRLSHGQSRFTYHTDHERVVLCEPADD